MKYFDNSEHEVEYGSIDMNPIIYQDDLARLSSSVIDAQAGIDKVEACMESKMLDLHDEKSCFLLFGRGKKAERVKDVFLTHP